MSIIVSLILFFLAIAVAVVGAIRPLRSRVSPFELKRRAAEGDAAAQLDTRREKAYVDVLALQGVLLAILLVIFTLVAAVAYGFWTAFALALPLSLFYGLLGRVNLVNKYADKLYQEREADLLKLAERYRSYFWWIRGRSNGKALAGVHSREELAHLVETTRALDGLEQKRLVLNALAFHERLVSEAMTPRSKLKTIKKTEILGPLVLDDLHQSGHQSFPVTNGDIDHIVGILRLQDVTTLDTARKHTSLVETAMRPQIQYIAQDRPLQEALDTLLRSQEHILIVVDEASQVVGLLTMSDIMRTLFGK